MVSQQLFKKLSAEGRASGQKPLTAMLAQRLVPTQPRLPAAGWGPLARGAGLGWAVPQALPSPAWVRPGGNRRREKLLCRQLTKTALQSLALEP